MIHSLLADLVVLLHLAFIVFVMGGGFLLLYSRRVAYLHLPAAAWGAFVELTGGVCPLTPLEVDLRQEAGQGGYASSFIDRYLNPIIYPPDLTHEVQVAEGALVLLVNAVVYASILGRAKREGRTGAAQS